MPNLKYEIRSLYASDNLDSRVAIFEQLLRKIEDLEKEVDYMRERAVFR